MRNVIYYVKYSFPYQICRLNYQRSGVFCEINLNVEHNDIALCTSVQLIELHCIHVATKVQYIGE